MKPAHNAKTDRNKRIYMLYFANENISMAEIGKMFGGLSRQAVSKIIQREEKKNENQH